MTEDASELIKSLTRALEALPDDVELRVHLAEVLAAAARPQDALDHCAVVLGVDPANRKALEVGVAAATAAGDDRRASAYRQALSNLGASGPVSNSPVASFLSMASARMGEPQSTCNASACLPHFFETSNHLSENAPHMQFRTFF